MQTFRELQAAPEGRRKCSNRNMPPDIRSENWNVLPARHKPLNHSLATCCNWPASIPVCGFLMQDAAVVMWLFGYPISLGSE
jgi:hypothetical protein